MVGLRVLRWVCCWALFAMACGRTAKSDSDGNVSSNENGARSGSGATGGNATTGGSGPTSHAGTTGEAGELGAAGAPAECPATPIAGRWVARGPDPYGLELKNDGTQVFGEGCLGGFGAPGEPPLLDCNPLHVQADTGRSFEFVWDAGPASGIPYTMRMQLTLSPERNAMAGKLWSNFVGFEGEGLDIVFVPYPGEPTLPATSCSGGEPSGACFLAPLRSDRVERPRIVELANGDLLVLWLNQRGVGKQLAFARFDAASATWQPAEFLDDGSAPVASLLVATSAGGWAMVAYTQAEAVVTRAYSPKTTAWSKPQLVARAEQPNVLQPSGLSVYDGGDAFLVVSTQFVDRVGSLAAYDYRAATDAWATPHVLEATAENSHEWAVGSDADRRQLVVWVRGGAVDQPHELWFSSRSWPGPWTVPAQFFSSDSQILRPATAVDHYGMAVVTWQEWTKGINSNTYGFERGSWGSTSMITTETQRDNRVVRFNQSGNAEAYFHDSSARSGQGELKSEFVGGAWGAPQACTEVEVSGETYTLAVGASELDIEYVVPGQIGRSFPPLERPRCEGY